MDKNERIDMLLVLASVAIGAAALIYLIVGAYQ